MQTKTYFSSSVPAALELARKELGEEALLVNSKPATGAGKSYGRLEVTFAYEGAPALKLSEAPKRALSEMEEIRRQISELRTAATRGAGGFAEARSGDEFQLIAAGFEEDVAREICSAVGRRGGGSLAGEIAGRIAQGSFPEFKAGESRTLAFIGPAGRGKTTTLVKIALRYGLMQKVPVHIYSAGAHGVGGQEQMARYAAILGVPFQACESLDSLHLSLNGDGSRGLILIDTPGIGPSDARESGDLARFFSRRPEIERHLVLRADARSADMSSVLNRFSDMGASKLLFTGLDEASGAGAMLNTLIQSGLPAVFCGTGQEIPGDLEEANIARMVRSVCGEHALAAAA